MKKLDIEQMLTKSAPKDSAVDTTFTDKVMDRLHTRPSHILQQNKKRSFASWLIHLPKFALVILAVAILFTISGVAYAVVETIKIQKSVEIQNHGKNDNGREELTVGFNNCEAQKKVGTTYEIKKDSGLTSEEAAKTLEARCEVDAITSWLKEDAAIKSATKDNPMLTSMYTQIIGKIISITPDEIAIDFESRQDKFTFPTDSRVIENGQVKERASIQPGDSVLLFSPYYQTLHKQNLNPNENAVLFKLQLEPKYYRTLMQWYVGARGVCDNNPERNCLLHNNINKVFLRVTSGGANSSINDAASGRTPRTVQGRVTEFTNSYIKIDAGSGVIYTIKTSFNVIEKYNHITVYGLASYDRIYADTSVEALKIAVGDSLDINYAEPTEQMSQTINWQDIYGIDLMVERTAKEMNILTKY